MAADFSSGFPLLISAYWKQVLARLQAAAAQQDSGIPDSGIDALSWYHAMERQVMPSRHEENVLPGELDDPLGAGHHQVTPRMVHQYKNRVLVLTTSRCFAHCRYCFRKDYISNTSSQEVSSRDWIQSQEIDSMCQYLASHPEVQEALLSGGDPLTVPFQQLEKLVARFRAARPGILVRLCTRAPSFNPAIFTESLVERLRNLRPLWLIPHINHPVEISAAYAPESRKALLRLVDSGVPVQSQTVLLRGVNDDVSILARLFQDLASLGVKPGYLFQCDLVPGISHLRLPVEEGLALYHQLRLELSGLSTPVYAVDLPGGGGKFNLLELNPTLNPTRVQRLDDCYQFTKADGSVWWYPR